MNFKAKQNLISKISEGNNIVVIDPKGELFKETAKKLENVKGKGYK